MININYKDLKKRHNGISKYDLGAKPASGRQVNLDSSVQDSYYTDYGTPITDSFVPEAITGAVGNITSSLANANWKAIKNIPKAFNDKVVTPIKGGSLPSAASMQAPVSTPGSVLAATTLTKSVTPTVASTLPESGKIVMDAATQASLQTAGDAAKEAVADQIYGTTTGSGNAALGAATKVLSVAGILHGGYGMAKSAFDTSTINNPLTFASNYKVPVNGVMIDQYGGIDAEGLSKYRRNLTTSKMISGASSGFETGMGVGSLLAGPTGGLSYLAVPLLTAFGALGGLFGAGKAKKKLDQRIDNMRTGISGYNRQSYSEGASQGLRNIFNAKHGVFADKGLDPFSGNPNARVGALETLVKTKEDKHGNLRVTDAKTMPLQPGKHEYRADDYYVNLDEGTGVVGNKIDPVSGLPYSFLAISSAQKFNSNDPYEKAQGEQELLAELNKQSKTPSNNPSPYDTYFADQGKDVNKMQKRKLPKFNEGLTMSLLPAVFGSVAGLTQLHRHKNAVPSRTNVYAQDTESPQYMQALASRIFDIRPAANSINKAARQAFYDLTQQGSLTPGQRQAQWAALQNNKMNAIVDLYTKASEIQNQYIADYAKSGLEISNQKATRKQQANIYNDERNAKALANIETLIGNDWKNSLAPIYDFFKNYNNFRYQDKYLGLVSQQLSDEQKQWLNNYNGTTGFNIDKYRNMKPYQITFRPS